MKMLRDQIKTMEITTKKKIHPVREKIEIYSNLNIPFPYINTKASEEHKYNEAFYEELYLVQSMWDDLGVTEEYRQVFENIAKELDENLRRGFFEFEINSLKKFSDNLFKLSKDINGREKSISQLRHIDETPTISKEKLNEKLLDEVILLIRNLRIQSINIIYHFNKIREISSYNILAGKFNLEKMNKIYLYDRNYLIKMRSDLVFLNSSNLAEYFEFSSQSDPFLVATSDNSRNQNKVKVPISPEMLHSITECEFHMLNDIVFFRMQAKKINNNLQYSPITNKSPKHFKLNYPLAQPVKLNKSKLNSLQTASKYRPSSSSNEFYKLSEKSPEKYQKMFLTKMNENFLKTYRDKKIIIENKIKIEREDYKSHDNFKNPKTNQSKERAKSSRKEKKDFKLNKNEYDYLYSYNSVIAKPISKKDVSPYGKLEQISNKQITIENKESIETNKENYKFNSNDQIRISQEKIFKISDNKNYTQNIIEKLPSLNKSEIQKDTVQNNSYHDSKDISYNSVKVKKENIDEFVIKEEADEKISDEIFEKENSRKGSLLSNNKTNDNKVHSDQAKEESQFLVEEIVGIQHIKEIKENSFENLKKSIGEKSQSYKSKDIKDNKDNLISRISNKISEDNRDLEDEINYDIYVEEEETKREKPSENNKNILDELKFEETEKLIHEEHKENEIEINVKRTGKEADSNYIKEEKLIVENESSLQNKSFKLVKQVVKKLENNLGEKEIEDDKEKVYQNEMKNSNKSAVEDENNLTKEENRWKVENEGKENIEIVNIKNNNESIQEKENSQNILDNNLNNNSVNIERLHERLKEKKSSLKMKHEKEKSEDVINEINKLSHTNLDNLDSEKIKLNEEEAVSTVEQNNLKEKIYLKSPKENYIETFNQEKIEEDNNFSKLKENKEHVPIRETEVIEVPEKQNELVNQMDQNRKNSLKNHSSILKSDVLQFEQEENKNQLVVEKLENDLNVKNEIIENKINDTVYDEVNNIFNQSINNVYHLVENQTNNEIFKKEYQIIEDNQIETNKENEKINEHNISQRKLTLEIQEQNKIFEKIREENIHENEFPPENNQDEKQQEMIREEKMDPKIAYQEENKEDLAQKIKSKMDILKQDKTVEEKIPDEVANKERIEEDVNTLEENIKEDNNKEGNNNEDSTKENKSPPEKFQELNIHEDKIKEKEESLNEEKITHQANIGMEARNSEKISDDNIDNQTHSKLQEIAPVSPISVNFFAGDLENLQSIYPIYLLKVNEEQKVSFKIENDLNNYLTGYYPKILLAYKDNMMVGICCVSYDSANDLNLRLNINHISTKLYDEFDLIACEFKNFILTNIPCDELSIGIYYEMKNGNLDINTKIRDIFKNNLKFKWSKLENKSNNERIQILNLKSENTNELMEAHKQRIKNFLNLEYLSVLKVEEIKEKKEIEVDEIKKKNEQNLNFFSFMFCLLELTKEYYELDNESLKKISLNEVEKLTKNIINCSGSREEIKEFIEKNLGQNFVSDLNPNLNSDLASNCIKSNLKFLNFLTTCIYVNDERYSPSLEILKDKESNQEFYLIPSIDGINSLIICELNESLESSLNKSRLNISQFFSELYFKLENNPNEDKKIKTVWLPCFDIKEKLSLVNPSCMSEIIVKKEGLEYSISHADEWVHFSLNYDYNYIKSPTLDPTEEDILIKGKFMIAIINYELLNEINIPSIFVYVVESAAFSKF